MRVLPQNFDPSQKRCVIDDKIDKCGEVRRAGDAELEHKGLAYATAKSEVKALN